MCWWGLGSFAEWKDTSSSSFPSSFQLSPPAPQNTPREALSSWGTRTVRYKPHEVQRSPCGSLGTCLPANSGACTSFSTPVSHCHLPCSLPDRQRKEVCPLSQCLEPFLPGSGCISESWALPGQGFSPTGFYAGAGTPPCSLMSQVWGAAWAPAASQALPGPAAYPRLRTTVVGPSAPSPLRHKTLLVFL